MLLLVLVVLLRAVRLRAGVCRFSVVRWSGGPGEFHSTTSLEFRRSCQCIRQSGVMAADGLTPTG